VSLKLEQSLFIGFLSLCPSTGPKEGLTLITKVGSEVVANIIATV
jgi:hypothetical protein